MIAVGSDHGGFELKCKVIDYLKQNNIDFKDYGCYSVDSCDYPAYAHNVGHAVADGICDRGILICSTGIGISIAANKIKGIRAALCHDCVSAQLTREHNDANILCMGAKIIGESLALKIVEIFLNTDFSEEERHLRRVCMIED